MLASATLAGCANLPASGPTAGRIVHDAKPGKNDLGFIVRPITPAVLAEVAASRAATIDGKLRLASLEAISRADEVGPGDVLEIAIYEVGVGLFGSTAHQADAQSFDPSARAENFPAVTVDRSGAITLPYINQLEVAGHTLPEIQTMIARAYRGQSQSPQVVVVLKENVNATVFVSGEVRKPGRFDLTLRGERVLDAIALAGGTTDAPEDTVVRFNRGAHALEERFDAIRTTATDDLQLIPGDRIEVIKRPRSFLVMGATGKVSQQPFDTSEVSLAEAMARVGGPIDSSANPAGIFVFRYEAPLRPGLPETPTIFRLNMMQPEGYFLSQRFGLQDKDVVYVSNSPTNALLKFVGILSQLFSPALAISYAAKQ